MISPLYFKTAAEWRDWLSKNHDSITEAWLLFYKKDQGKPSIAYENAVEEALCFGWIDSIIRKIDDATYARKFTPRKEDSKWSALNKKRVGRLISDGLMTEAGLAKIEAAKQNGMWDQPDRPRLALDMPADFADALAAHPTAKAFFEQLAPSYKKQYLAWVIVAKRQKTRQNRIREAIDLLQRGEKLGMK